MANWKWEEEEGEIEETYATVDMVENGVRKNRGKENNDGGEENK